MQITLYTLNQCQRCDATKRRLKDAPYTTINASEDQEAADMLRAAGHSAMPVVRVHDEDGNLVDEWTGFNPSKTSAAAALVKAQAAEKVQAVAVAA